MMKDSHSVFGVMLESRSRSLGSHFGAFGAVAQCPNLLVRKRGPFAYVRRNAPKFDLLARRMARQELVHRTSQCSIRKFRWRSNGTSPRPNIADRPCAGHRCQPAFTGNADGSLWRTCFSEVGMKKFRFMMGAQPRCLGPRRDRFHH